jgi:hypothetical protein
MLHQGIRVRADLIVGLPGDTLESVRKGLHYLRDLDLGSHVQVFNLAVLPGTAFRQEAAELGLVHQPRPPYYVLNTPTMNRTDLFGLMGEAQDLLGIEFDAQLPPVLDFGADSAQRVWRLDLDETDCSALPTARQLAQAFTIWFRSARFGKKVRDAVSAIRAVLEANPFTTLQVVIEPAGRLTSESIRREINPRLLGDLMTACQAGPTYLDKFYALQPGRPNGAKRLLVLLPLPLRERLPADWIDALAASATLVWTSPDPAGNDSMEPHEYVWNIGRSPACVPAPIATD